MIYSIFESKIRPVLMTAILIAGTTLGAFGEPVRAAESAQTAAKTQAAKRELSLDDLRDCAILLKLVKQQAINLYQEAAREKVKLDASADVPDIKSIPYKFDSKDLLPPRREWLIFYLGSMEPVIRDLGAEVEPSDAGLAPVIPEPYKKTFQSFWEQWSGDVKTLNHHLDQLVPLFDDAPHNNGKIQNVAVAIYEDVDGLETLRRQIFKNMQDLARQDPSSHILITPP
jgi:hypothetical protein